MRLVEEEEEGTASTHRTAQDTSNAERPKIVKVTQYAPMTSFDQSMALVAALLRP